jgi:hypothetical protein
VTHFIVSEEGTIYYLDLDLEKRKQVTRFIVSEGGTILLDLDLEKKEAT